MSALKKIFGAGDSRDDEVMYQTETNTSPSTATANVDRPIQSERDIGTGATSSSGITSSTATANVERPIQSDRDIGTGVTSSSGIGPSTATANTDRAIQSERDIGTGAQSTSGITSKLGNTSNVQGQSYGTSSATPIVQDDTPTQTTSPKSHWSPSNRASEDYRVTKTEPQASTTGSVIQDRGTTSTMATTAGATTAAATGTGATVYASDRYGGDSRQDDISSATYTERSYKIGSSPTTSRPTTADNSTNVGSAGSTTTPITTSTGDQIRSGDSSYNREAAGTGAAVFGTTIAGAGAYAASQRDNNQLSSSTQARDIQRPEQIDSSSRFAPAHVPGAFPTEDGADPNSNPTAAAGSPGGAAIPAVDHKLGYAPSDRQRYYGRPPSSPPASPPPTQSTFAESSKPPAQDEQHYGRDTAIAGGVAAGAGAVGYGTYQVSQRDSPATSSPTTTRSTTTSTTTTTSPTTQGSQRTLISSHIDPREKGDNLTKVESNQSQYGRASSLEGTSPYGRSSFGESRPVADATVPSPVGGEDKTTGSSYGAALGAGALGAGAVGAGATYAATRDEPSTVPPTTQTRDVDSTVSTSSSGEKKQGFFSKAFHGKNKDEEVKIGDSKPSNEIQRVPRAGGEVFDDDGLIHFVNEGADPNAPALIVREAPGGGIETVEDRR